MTIIYWNTHNIQDLKIIEELLKNKKPDILFLSEFDISILISNISTLTNLNYEISYNPGCDKIVTIKNINIHLEPSLQSTDFTVYYYKKNDIHIISLHLPSQLHRHMDDLKETIREFRLEIDNEIGNSLDTKILVIGDFNVNPYETPMINFDGFLASNAKFGRKTIKRRVTKSTYYNPTWKLYASEKFPGTKFYNRPSGSSYDITEFHYLDQVVLSRAFLDEVKDDKIYVLEKTKNIDLINKKTNRIIKGIDHLPLVYQFNF